MEQTDSKKLVAFAELRVDLENPRFPFTQPNQEEAVKAMVAHQTKKIVSLAEDISQRGLSKAESFMVMEMLDDAFVPYYNVLDGNRRAVALRILEQPSLTDGVLTPALRKRLQAASDHYKLNPIQQVEIALYANREEAAVWMERRHLNKLQGTGLEKWDSAEIKRFTASIKSEGKDSVLKPELQVLDFVKARGGFTPAELARIDKIQMTSTLERIVIASDVRAKIGYTLDGNNIRTKLADSEILKPFRRIILELTDPVSKTRLKVRRVFDKDDRELYFKKFGAEDLPDPTVALVQEHNLGAVYKPIPKADGSSTSGKKGSGGQATSGNNTTSGGGNTNSNAGGNGTSSNGSNANGNTATGGEQQNGSAGQGNGQNGTQSNPATTQNGTQQGSTNSQQSTIRVTIIPKDCALKITESRIQNICQELQFELPYEKCLNACALLLPVFIELSLDHYISRHHVAGSASTVVDKLQVVVGHTVAKSLLTSVDEEAIREASESGTLLMPTTAQMRSYSGKTPKAATRQREQLAEDLCAQWDALQPLMKIIWPV